MNQKQILGAAGAMWVATIAGAYFVGKSTGHDAGVIEVEKRIVLAGGSGSERLSAMGGNSPSAGKLTSPDNVPRTIAAGGNGLALLKSSLDNPNPVERMQAFMNAIAGLEADEFQAALEALSDNLQSGENQREISLLLYAWAEKDGAAALSHLDGKNLGRQGWGLYQSALSAWGGADPDAAEAWAIKKHEGKESNENYYMVGVINGLAKTDPMRAAQMTQDLGYGGARGNALGTVVDELFRQGDGTAMEWIESMGEEDARFRSGAAGRVAGRLAKDDPAAAAEWVMGLGLEESDKAVTSVAYTWGRQAPADAAAWTASIEDPTLRSRGMQSVVEMWARQDAQAAGEWLGGMPASPELDRPVQTYALTMQERDPQGAIGWANSITDQGTRDRVVGEIASRWMRRNSDEARAFLQQQDGLPDSVRQRLN